MNFNEWIMHVGMAAIIAMISYAATYIIGLLLMWLKDRRR